MRDLPERDEIRAAHAGDTGIAGHVERLMGERENAEAYGQDDRVSQIDEQLAGFGHTAAQVRAARKAAAEKKAAAEDEGQSEARKQAPAERKAPQEKQSSAEQPGKQKG